MDAGNHYQPGIDVWRLRPGRPLGRAIGRQERARNTVIEVMKLKKSDWPKIAALSAALLMVAVGAVLSRVTVGQEASAAQENGAAALPREAESVASSAAKSDALPAPSAEAGQDLGARPVASASTQQRDTPSADMSDPARSASQAAKKPAPARKSRPSYSLPPLPPPDWDTVKSAQEPLGPPPGVLWLSGVIQGEPKVAVLRRGENRYLVREGDTIEDRYTVQQIGSNSITLKRGSRKLTLRVGQY